MEINEILNNYYGLNITIPFKEKIFKYISPVDDAIFLNAVNTIFKDIGYNTDWIGFYNSIKKEKLNGKIIILGAGGASKAIIYGLYKLGVDKITLINRTYEKAMYLKKQFFKKIDINVKYFEKLNDEVEEASVFINTTSLGMFGESIPIDLTKKLELIYDVIYFYTPLQREAQNMGIKVLNGEKMWYFQSIENLKIWNIYDSNKFDEIFNSLKL
ncbi:shikimate dehydrogenase [Marinitoga hydrogenitolerans DSM 16785]|uniref:shikimate dehydrogenase (NADP(+)) n=1 Tax=Marinitoga hydrogenitolerans (strain DSM 16785 / JCM 12826 / AT1271) TaxID=1122195 RepID=A0A1M4ZTG8_MARH1|nr:shikimate dehydrogenase [Marinitoga hydrogenitolerans DSM 16785]